jgi:hypothetical protein
MHANSSVGRGNLSVRGIKHTAPEFSSPGCLTVLSPEGTKRPPRRRPAVPASIEILYLRFPVHPNISVIEVGPGIGRIDKDGTSYFVIGTGDGPLAGKRLEIPAENVAAIQWALETPAS